MAYLDLEYGTPKHDKLRDAIRARTRAGRDKLAPRRAKWREAERLYTAYTPETDEDAKRRLSRDSGSPQYTTVIIPYSYATLLTAHTYWASVFLSRNPILQYTARHGESQQQVQAVEAYVDYQVQVGRMLVPFYGWLLDPGRYGVGILGNYWTSEKIKQTVISERPKTFLGVEVPGTSQTVKETKTLQGYLGNKVFNVRPQDFFYDPRVSLVNFQEGEYCGRVVYVGWNTIAKGAAAGKYFNIDKISSAAYAFFHGGEGRDKGAGLQELPDDILAMEYTRGELEQGGKPRVTELTEFDWELIPADWDLGKSTYPEKWVFTVAFDEVIIGCQPRDELHNQYPYFVQAYEFDPYVYSGRGMMEVMKPLNDILDWLFNSHMFNVRKVLNGEFVVDPMRVLIRDMKEGGPGRLVRLAPAAYGTDPSTVVHQLQVQDVTAQHLKSLQMVLELIMRVTGVNDNLMGLVHPGGRKSATEVRTSTSFGVNRLKTVSEYNSALGWAPLAQVLLQNSQQRYDAPMKLRIAGDLAISAQESLLVRPEDITGFFDFVPVDGTLPVDRFAQANLWKEILMGLYQVPQLAMGYNIGGIFEWMAQLAGLKNITQFRLKPQVMPDETVMAGVDKGSLRPMPGGSPEMQLGSPGEGPVQ